MATIDDSQANNVGTAVLIEYRLPDGWVARVGKTDEDNDALSLDIARPDDWWFHVRGMPGGHVVLSARDDAEPDRKTRERVAALALYHSKARTAGVTGVSCTRARFVSKPRGAKPGTVEIRRESVLRVRPATAEEVALYQPRSVRPPRKADR